MENIKIREGLNGEFEGLKNLLLEKIQADKNSALTKTFLKFVSISSELIELQESLINENESNLELNKYSPTKGGKNKTYKNKVRRNKSKKRQIKTNKVKNIKTKKYKK